MTALPRPEQQPDDTDPDHNRPCPSIDDIAAALRLVVRDGTHPARLRERSVLLTLGCVRRRTDTAGYPATADGHALALQNVINDALDALGEGAYGIAARRLFGAATDTRGRPLADRRRIAADALDLLATTFRKHYEPRILLDVAAEMLRLEANQ